MQINRLKISILFVLSIFLSGACSMGNSQGKAAQTVVEKHGKLSVKGTKLVDEKGVPITLRGVSFGWHNWWSQFYNDYSVTTLADDWGSTVVRAAIGVGPRGGYIDNPGLAMECLTAVVESAIKKGIYVIIDWHSHDIYLEEAKAFFTGMAQKYKDYPNVIYELFNEPDYETWDEVKAYSVELIKTIRAIDSDNLIIVGLPHWDQDVHIVADDPITGYNNLVYALHFYAATHKEDLRKRADYALSKGLPIFVSECAGMEATGDGPINKQEWNNWVEWMDANNLSWLAWSVSSKDETCSMLKPSVNPQGPWNESDLKEWALIVRTELQKQQK